MRCLADFLPERLVRPCGGYDGFSVRERTRTR
jgi:hypothetical protein